MRSPAMKGNVLMLDQLWYDLISLFYSENTLCKNVQEPKSSQVYI